MAALVFLAIKVIPVLVDEYQFEDGIKNIATFASGTHSSNEQVVKEVLAEAQKEDLPIQREDIKVEGTGGNIRINVEYSVTVDLMVYKWTMNFHPSASNKALI